MLFDVLYGIPISRFPIRRQCHQVFSGTLSTLHRALKHLQARRLTVESCSLKLEENVSGMQFKFFIYLIKSEMNSQLKHE